MFILKSCPKCRGDLSVEQDNFSRALFTKDTDFACLQCGYRLLANERRAMLLRIKRWSEATAARARLGGTGGAIPAV
jgi:hypothetical protein